MDLWQPYGKHPVVDNKMQLDLSIWTVKSSGGAAYYRGQLFPHTRHIQISPFTH